MDYERLGVEETPADYPKDAIGLADRWRHEIRGALAARKDSDERSRKIIRRYLDADEGGLNRPLQNRLNSDAHMNILWSNVQTIKPALYSRTPKPEFVRKPDNADPVSREAVEVLEAGAEFVIDDSAFDEAMESAMLDVLLPGIGAVWVRYDPQIVGEGIDEEVVFEQIAVEHVPWCDFLYDPASCWRLVRWVARKLVLDRADLQKFFGGKIGLDIPLNYYDSHKPNDRGSKDDNVREIWGKAIIWEIWCKTERKVYWLSMDYDKILRVQDDFLKLRKFWPCAKPMFATHATDSLIPTPDFEYYRHQADEVDTFSYKIQLLSDAIRLAGVRDASIPALDKLLKSTTGNVLVPIPNYAQFQQAGGFRGVMEWMPLADIIGALRELYQSREQVKNEIYEIIGISDILRGVSNPQETATAQEMKGQFASARLRQRQRDVQRFARDTIEIIAEIIGEQFSPDTLSLMIGRPINPATLELIRSDKLRTFKVDIETDSTIAIDRDVEKQDRISALSAIGDYMQQAIAVSQQTPELLPFMIEGVLFMVRSFKAARSLESSLERGLQGLMQRIQQQQQQPPQPDPKTMLAQGELQLKQQQMQMEMQKLQAEMQQMQMKIQAELQKAQIKAQTESEKTQARYAADMAEIQVKSRDSQLQEQKITADMMADSQNAQLKAAEIQQRARANMIGSIF